MMTTVIGNGVKFIAWGVEWKNFFDLCQQLQSEPDSVFKMKRPAKFSETKFADHAHEVYDKFRNNYKPLILILEQVTVLVFYYSFLFPLYRPLIWGTGDHQTRRRRKNLPWRSRNGFTTGILCSASPWSLMSTKSTGRSVACFR